MKGKTQQAAAAASDMSERSVRNWNKGTVAVGEEGQEKEEYETGPVRRRVGGGSRAFARGGCGQDTRSANCSRVAGRASSRTVQRIAPADAAATYTGLARAERA